jgi:hypothetical protein
MRWCGAILGPGPHQLQGASGLAKILVVEDNEVNQRILVRRLERRGHEVVLANDGGEGVAMAASETPDLMRVSSRARCRRSCPRASKTFPDFSAPKKT